LIEGTLVPTANRGDVPVEELTPSDELIGERGIVKLEAMPKRRTIHPVAASASDVGGCSDSTQELYVIRTELGDYTVTGDHRLTVHWCNGARPAPVLESTQVGRAGGTHHVPVEFTNVRIRWWTVDAAGNLTRQSKSMRIECTDTQRQPRSSAAAEQDSSVSAAAASSQRSAPVASVAAAAAAGASAPSSPDEGDDSMASEEEDADDNTTIDDDEDSRQIEQYKALSQVSSPAAASSAAAPAYWIIEGVSVKLDERVKGTKQELLAHFKTVRDELIKESTNPNCMPIRDNTLVEISARSLFKHRALLLRTGTTTPQIAVAWTPLAAAPEAVVPLQPDPSVHWGDGHVRAHEAHTAAAVAAAGGAAQVSSECVQFLDAAGTWQSLSAGVHAPPVKVALQLHNPLVSRGSSILSTDGKVSVTFNNINSVLTTALQIDPATAGLVALELNPIASMTGAMQSHLKPYDNVSRQGLRFALQLRAESIVAFGWFTRYRWQHDAQSLADDYLRINSVASVKQYHQVDGLRISYAVLEQGSWMECQTTVWFAPHPCQTHRIGEVGMALAAAFGRNEAVAKAAQLSLRSRLPRMTIEQMEVTEPVNTYSLTVIGNTEEDRRHAIKGGILTHNCLTGETLIATGSGFSLPIRAVAAGTPVLSFDTAQAGHVLQPTSALLAQGTRPCIELLFEDGRTIKCTPDHRFLTKEGEWIEAQHMEVGATRVNASMEYPVLQQPTADDWQLRLPTLGYALNTRDRLPHALAFAGLLGCLLTDGTIGESTSAVLLGHGLDAAWVQRDIHLLTGLSVSATRSGKIISVALPKTLRQAMRSVGVSTDNRLLSVAGFPAFLLEPRCPASVVQAFLGGLFGGDGKAPSLSWRKGGRANTAEIRWGCSRKGAVMEAAEHRLSEELRVLFQRVGMRAEAIYFASGRHQVTEVTEEGRAEVARRKEEGEPLSVSALKFLDPAASYSLLWHVRWGDTLAFSERIGFRYCCHKQMRLTAAVTYYRQHAVLERQKAFLQEHVRAYEAGRGGRHVTPDELPTVLAAAKRALSEQECIHPVIRDYQPDRNRRKALFTGVYRQFGPSITDILRSADALKFFSPPRKGKKYDAATRQRFFKDQPVALCKGREECPPWDVDSSTCPECGGARLIPPTPSPEPEDEPMTDAWSAAPSASVSVASSAAASAASSRRASVVGTEAVAAVPEAADKVVYGVPAGATALPTFSVRLIGRRDVGAQPVFDLTVPRTANFTAAGLTAHNCNFMLDRVSGQIVHIDFGDCFEVAMHREKYPEKIPFRLTRMLVHAMEVSGIDGTFRATCETVMRVLRKNKNSVMAVLEAFVHDPLINWRLLETANKDDKQKPAAAAAAAATPNVNKTTKQGSGAAAAPADDEHKEGTGTARGVPEGAPAALPHGGHGHGGGHGHRMHEVVVGSAVSHALLAERRRSVVEMEQQADAMAAAAPAAAGAGGAGGVAGSVVGQAVVGVVAATASVANEQLNRKAVAVIARVESKLKGTDFMDSTGPANQHVLDVPGQVQRLIVEATSHINLCQSYVSTQHAHTLSCAYNATHALLRGTGFRTAVPAACSAHHFVSNVFSLLSICFFSVCVKIGWYGDNSHKHRNHTNHSFRPREAASHPCVCVFVFLLILLCLFFTRAFLRSGVRSGKTGKLVCVLIIPSPLSSWSSRRSAFADGCSRVRPNNSTFWLTRKSLTVLPCQAANHFAISHCSDSSCISIESFAKHSSFDCESTFCAAR
jgi:hypothetical protein